MYMEDVLKSNKTLKTIVFYSNLFTTKLLQFL